MDIKQFIDENLPQMKEDLRQLVSYESVYNTDEKPFGSKNRKVLDAAIQMMKDKGLETENLDYYCGYGQCGNGEDIIGILAHLDIVPVSEGWNSDPFTMIEKEGFLYGRGVSDDKGAAVASMYALKYLIDEKYPFNKRVRLILGCNEETGSKCIKHYVEKQGHIACGFTPDGNFPGIFAEKGILGGTLLGHQTSFIDIQGGEASNIVCKKCVVKLPNDSFDTAKLDDFFVKNNIKYVIKVEDNTIIEVNGTAAHASTPDLGKNAFSYLMEALYYAEYDDEFIKWFHEYFALSLHGEKLGYEQLKDEYTDTSINFGVVGKKDDDLIVSLDMRFPVKSSIEECLEPLMKINNSKNEFVYDRGEKPLFFDIDSPMIKALKKAYEDVTGDKQSKMQAIGGGTYAKAINNCIAFGCEFQNEDNHIHDANESLNIEAFKKQVEIYVEAIKNLNNI